jgi:hypothetical protein
MALTRQGVRITPSVLARLLVGLALKGYREVPGYTVAEVESTGDVYVSMQLTKGPRP